MPQQTFPALKFLRWSSITTCSIVLLTACQSASTPKGTAESYLSALKSNDIKSQQELGCHKSEPVKGSERLTGLQEWQVTGEELKTDEQDPDGRYNIVSMKVKSIATGGFSVTQTWKLRVWKSDELFESNKRFIGKLNQQLAESQQVLVEASKITGDAPPKLDPPVVPERESITSNPYCVVMVEAA